MRKTFPFCLLLASHAVVAQNYGVPPVSQEQMQQMMQQMQGVQDCMSQVDPSAMQAMQAKAEKMDAEVKALCASGQRDAAQARALAFAKETAADPAVREMQKCGKGMQDLMPHRPGSEPAPTAGGKPQHVCDAPD